MPKKTKSKVPPHPSEAAPFERFEDFTRRIVQVPKSEVGKEKKRERRGKQPRRRPEAGL